MKASESPDHVQTLIVGSGVAATAIARELLAADPDAHILILEAGPRVEMKDFRLWENLVATGQKPYSYCEDLPYPTKDSYGQNQSRGQTTVPLQGSRLMIYGGSTVHWGGWSFRLKPEDFALQTNAGENIDWPFDYTDLEPYYTQAEAYIGVSGSAKGSPVPRDSEYPFPAFPYTLEDSIVIDAFEALDIDYSHLPIARHGITSTDGPHAPCQTTGTCKYCPFGARFVAGNTLDLLVQRYANLDVRYHAVVERLVMQSPTVVAGALWSDTHSQACYQTTADRVIVAAGAIESPKLLLRSRDDDWPHGIGNQHDLVGRNLITHPYFIIEATLPANPLGLRPEMDFPTLCSRHFDSAEEQKAGKFIFVNPPSSPAASAKGDIASMMKRGLSRDTIDAALAGETTVQLHGMVETFSRFDNRVQNVAATNQFGLPQTAVTYTQDPDFDARMQQVVDQAARVFEKMGATDVRLANVSWRADHAACTCRMAERPEDGVVDPNLRVHGVDNLYVCSNAVFPSLGAVNPTLTLSALSLRLGQHLARQP